MTGKHVYEALRDYLRQFSGRRDFYDLYLESNAYDLCATHLYGVGALEIENSNEPFLCKDALELVLTPDDERSRQDEVLSDSFYRVCGGCGHHHCSFDRGDLRDEDECESCGASDWRPIESY